MVPCTLWLGIPFECSLAPRVPEVRESENRPLLVPPRFPNRHMVEHLLIGPLGAVLIEGAQVFHLNAVHIPDPLVHPGFEFLHRRQIGGNGIRGPNIGGRDPVQWQAPASYDLQHFQTVLAVGNTGYVLGAINDHRPFL